MISMMFDASSRTGYLTTSTSGLSALIVAWAESTFGVPIVVVDDAERPHPGRGEVERRRSAQPAGAEQQHLRVEQLGLAVGPHLGQQDVAAVALLLLRRQQLRDLDLVAPVLPERDAARHRPDVRVSEEIGQRVRGERRALAGGAVEDDGRVAVADGAVDPGLEVPPRHVHGAGDVPAIPLLRLAHVHEGDAVAEVLGDLGRIDLLDLLLDLPDDLGSGRAHLNSSGSRSGFNTSRRIAPYGVIPA